MSLDILPCCRFVSKKPKTTRRCWYFLETSAYQAEVYYSVTSTLSPTLIDTYYNMGYVNSIAKKVFAEQTYDFVTSRLVTSVLERIVKLDPLINMYYNYLQSDADVLNTYHEQLFMKHDKETLCRFYGAGIPP